MLPENQLRARLRRLSGITIAGPWSRAVDLAALLRGAPGAAADARPRPRWAGGPPLNGQRFTPRGGAAALYLASESVTAALEVGAVLAIPSEGLHPIRLPPLLTVTVVGALMDVLDLTDAHVQARLGTNEQELTGPWRRMQDRGEVVPTQLLGQLAFESKRFTGLISYSAKNDVSGRTIVVFPERLRPPSRLAVYDPAGHLSEELP